jgi:glycogen debranching enzyme
MPGVAAFTAMGSGPVHRRRCDDRAVAPLQPLLHDLTVTLRAPTVCLSAPDGQLRGAGTQGVLCADLRVVARAVVTVDGAEPEPIAHGMGGASAEHFIGVLRHLGPPASDPTVWLRRDREVRAAGIGESFTLVNDSDEPLTADLRLAFDADFAPLHTIKAGAPVAEAGAPGVAVTLDAPGATVTSPGAGEAAAVPVPGAAAVPAVSASRAGHCADAASYPAAVPAVLRWTLAVSARSSASCRWSLSVHDTGAVVAPVTLRLDRPAAVQADDPRLAALLDRALDDLDALLLAEPDHPGDVFAGAGAPWYLTLFGRDALWTATMLLPFDVTLAAGTLRTLARAQGRTVDPVTGEAQGKILHELRRGTAVAPTERLPPRYYGTVDATPLWICLLRDAWRWGLPDGEVRALLPHLEAALGWVASHGDGFVAYYNPSGRGLANQGWKDSVDAVRFADGRRAEGPVALAEVQGYAHEAALAGTELLAAFGVASADRWRTYAAELAARFRRRFWVADADGTFPALALDGIGVPVDAPASNMGHLLGTGLLDDAESGLVAGRLLGPDMASGFGLRTMSRRADGYSPLSYHCGSVWPHDTAIAARGLSRAGHGAVAAALVGQLLTAAGFFDRRLPELYAGMGADEVSAPVPYPASCRPQAWAAAAAVEMLRVVLGLTVDVPSRVITLRPPSPSPVGAVAVRGLAVGPGRLDVAVDRAGRVTHVSAPSGFRVDTR